MPVTSAIPIAISVPANGKPFGRSLAENHDCNRHANRGGYRAEQADIDWSAALLQDEENRKLRGKYHDLNGDQQDRFTRWRQLQLYLQRYENCSKTDALFLPRVFTSVRRAAFGLAAGPSGPPIAELRVSSPHPSRLGKITMNAPAHFATAASACCR